MNAAIWLVLVGLAVPAYAYVGYPLVLLFMGMFARRRPSTRPETWPTVTITVPAYNEEDRIEETLEALLDVDYPRERIQLLVVSDASTDRTDEIVRGFGERGVQLLRIPERVGKTGAENRALQLVSGEIVVNTDASVRIQRDALKRLIAHFSDPAVGLVSGRDVSVAPGHDPSNIGETGYVGYEMWVRRLETRVSSIVGASGCFYAVRADLHRTLVPEALSRDFAAAMITREAGYRAVSAHDAVCLVPRSKSLHQEFHRKSRTMTRGLHTLFYKRRLLNPLRHGVFAWMLFSHKLVRWLVPVALLLGTVGLVLISATVGWARLALAAGAVVTLLGVLGWYWPAPSLPRILALPAYFVSGNVAALQAWARALAGEMRPTWEPTRRESVKGS